MKKVLSFVAAFVAVAVMMVSCASQNDLKTVEMAEAMKANDVAKVETIVNELANQDASALSGDNKACVVLGYIFLANKAYEAGDAEKYVENRNMVMGIHEACKAEPDYVKACNTVKETNPQIDIFAMSENIKNTILEEAIDAANAEDAEDAEDEDVEEDEE